jgi:histone deacetylase 11
MSKIRLIFFNVLNLIFFCIDVGYGCCCFCCKKKNNKIPIVYHPGYNISLGEELQKLHSFDGCKYGKVFNHLVTTVGIDKDLFYKPKPVSDKDLQEIHDNSYLETLKIPKTIAAIANVDELAEYASGVLDKTILLPMRLAVGGTILGVMLALRYYWAINLAGGYHHAKRDSGGGFCFYADIALAIKKIWSKQPQCKVMIVDLDAHQGNGNEDIFAFEERVAIFDMYNEDIYPKDQEAKDFIAYNIPLKFGTGDTVYMNTLKEKLPAAIKMFNPNLIIYNAGTDILIGDKLGRFCISKKGVKDRDAFVFQTAINNHIPILMVLSGGYTPESVEIISESIEDILRNVIKVID